MIARFRNDWNEFWFALRPGTTLGLFRIGFGLILMSWCLLLAPDAKAWYSEQGLMPLTAVKAWGADSEGFSILTMLNITDFRVTVALFCILFLSAALLTIGLWSRAAAVVSFLLLISFQHRDMIILNGGDTLLRCMSFYLLFADSGASCSVDRLVRVWRGIERGDQVAMVEAWPQRLMQLQLSAVYISTVLSKLEGQEWLNGTALYFALHLTDLQRFPTFGLIDHAWFYVPSTYFTLAAEFSLGTLIWVPRLRPYVLMVGVVLHTVIEYLMNVPLFEYIMVLSYINFVPFDWVDSARLWIKRNLTNSQMAMPANLQLSPNFHALLPALDSLNLVSADSYSAPTADPRAAVRRMFWRFPVTWAFCFVPPAVILVFLPTRWLLLGFGVVWPCACAYALTHIAAAVALAPQIPPITPTSSDNRPVSEMAMSDIK